jgi:hypothetical protein
MTAIGANKAASMTGVLQMDWLAAAGGMGSVGVVRWAMVYTFDMLGLESVRDMADRGIKVELCSIHKVLMLIAMM